MRKPVFGVRPGQTQTGLYNNRRWIEARNFVYRKKRDCTIFVAKTKALICVFVFAYEERWFSHVAAHMVACAIAQ